MVIEHEYSLRLVGLGVLAERPLEMCVLSQGVGRFNVLLGDALGIAAPLGAVIRP